MNMNEGSMGDSIRDLFEQLKMNDSVVRIQLNDQRLMKLAEYDATHGFMNPKVTQDLLQERFNELKGLVKKGSFTLKALEEDVYSKWGIDEEGREDALRKEMDSGTPHNPITGFGPIDFADIPEDSPENT